MTKNTKLLKSELNVRATASLNEEVAEELKVEDPTIEQAKAALDEHLLEGHGSPIDNPSK